MNETAPTYRLTPVEVGDSCILRLKWREKNQKPLSFYCNDEEKEGVRGEGEPETKLTHLRHNYHPVDGIRGGEAFAKAKKETSRFFVHRLPGHAAIVM
ncbi:hypothetical protein [Saccharococcus caldoxylosilyticus]|uniref:hypothetical protein n=1 Tax=Saccharococcus caldoxylosilyticus TaxID=81408 RepID=UPI001FCC465C|nr:hypothetical protein [Parageobacillus caldoxylosilyticus]